MRKGIIFLGITTLFFLILPFFWVPIVRADKGGGISVDADEVEYDLEHRYIVAKGSVKVKGEDYEVHADFIKVDMVGDTLYSRGHVRFIRKEGTVEGREVFYHIRDGRGEVKGVKGTINAFSVEGDSFRLEGGGKGVLLDGSITSCDLPNPCYIVRAGRVTFIPGEEIVAERVTLFVKGFPLFYLPRYTVSLKPGAPALAPIVKASYESELGVTLGYSQGFRIGTQGYGRVGGVYASRKGLDIELNYDYLFAPGLLGGLKVVREAGAAPMGGINLNLTKEWASGWFNSSIAYLWGEGLSGSLKYTKGLGGDLNFGLEASEKAGEPLVGKVFLRRERMGYLANVEYRRELKDDGVVEWQPEVTFSFNPPAPERGQKRGYSGGAAFALIEDEGHGARTWKGEVWSRMESTPFPLGREASIRFGGGTGYAIYGTQEAQGYVEGFASMKLRLASFGDASVTYEKRIPYGSSPFHFDEFQWKDSVKGTVELKLGAKWAISASGEMNVMSGSFTELKYEVIRDLHCFEARVGWEPLKSRWDARIDLIPF